MACNTCKAPNLYSKIKSFIRAIFSKRDKQLGATRFTICKTYNKAIIDGKLTYKPCEGYYEKNGRAFCSQCGCSDKYPMSIASNLATKTTMTKAECPLGRW